METRIRFTRFKAIRSAAGNYLALLLCFLAGNLCSQKAADLKAEYSQATHDTARCRILNALIETEDNSDIWPEDNKEMKAIAEKNIAKSGALKTIYLKYLALSLNNIAYLANYQGDVKKALECMHQALKIQEQVADKAGMAVTLNNLGVIYKDQGETRKAMENMQKSIKVQQLIGNKRGEAYSLNSLGGIYYDKGDMQAALEYYMKGLKINEEVSDRALSDELLNNIGTVYDTQNDFSRAMKYYTESLKLRRERSDQHGIINSLNNMASLMYKKKQIREAQQLGLEAYKMAKEIGFPESIGQSAQILKKIFMAQNNFRQGMFFFELEVKMRDSVSNLENRKEAVQKQLQYEFEKKEAVSSAEHKSEMEKQQAVSGERERRQRSVIWSVVVGLIFVMIFAGFVVRSLRLTRRQKAEIERKNKETEQQKKIIEEKQKEIIDSIKYALRIQQALITNETYIEKKLSELQPPSA